MRRLRLHIAMIFMLVLAFGAAKAQIPQLGQNLASLVYIDGKNVVQDAEFALGRDQLLNLETYDLLPNSEVEVKATSKSSKNYKETFTTNQKGALKKILFFPKAKSTVKCVIQFTTQNGQPKKLKFQLKPV